MAQKKLFRGGECGCVSGYCQWVRGAMSKGEKNNASTDTV